MICYIHTLRICVNKYISTEQWLRERVSMLKFVLALSQLLPNFIIIIIILLLLLLLFSAIWLSPGGSGYFTCIQNMKLVTNIFMSEGLHEKHAVATWNIGNRLSICL